MSKMIIEIPDERTARALEAVLERFVKGTKRATPPGTGDSDLVAEEQLLRPIYNQLLRRDWPPW